MGVPEPRTLASRFIVLILCLALVFSTLAFGAVQAWALGFFQAGAGLIAILWAIDAWRTRRLRLSRNLLQVPLVGLFIVGLVQLLPLGAAVATGGLTNAPAATLTLDPYATRFVLLQLGSLIIYFSAALVYTDSPGRLRLLVRVVTVFGFLLALFGMFQYFTNPSQIYWFRQPKYALPFGPFINRHHFAAYMELTLALPLGLLVSGAIAVERRLLYIFAVVIMSAALVLTASRGAIVSLGAEVLFIAAIAGLVRRKKEKGETPEGEAAESRVRSALVRVGLGFALVVALLAGAVWLGGEESLARLFGTVNAEDPTSGRMQFWQGTWSVIKQYPLLGAGLGAFSVIYTRHDVLNGATRLEQAHNDYLQILSDAGIVGGALGLFFIFMLFRYGFSRFDSGDKFRRGVAAGALAGCFAVLVHSFFEFSLHMTSNALLFLVLAALATLNGRVEEPDTKRRSRGRRRRSSSRSSSAETGDGEARAS